MASKKREQKVQVQGGVHSFRDWYLEACDSRMGENGRQRGWENRMESNEIENGLACQPKQFRQCFRGRELLKNIFSILTFN